jgi:RND family efflux transporter MFP subunit
VALGDQVEGLQAYLRAANSNYEVTEALQITKEAVGSTLDLVELFITIFKDDEDVVRTDKFSNLRSLLINTQLALNNERTALESALDTVTRAQLGANESNSSAANAQVKQALGSLRAAQANLAKTIIRTPISGTVNSLDIRTGDFVNSFAQVALVANNNALEIITFIGENDREVFAIGDTVTLDGQYDGTVTRIAPAVNAGTGKTEVRIASESQDLQNGDSVRVNKEVAGDTISQVIIPLSAVKFALNDGSVFVIEDNKLVDRPVTLGTVRGGSVEILDGLSITDEFVADARGLVAATEVEVIR